MPETPEIDFDFSKAISLADACKLIRGRGGKRVHRETLRRWADPRKGCRPAGESGPVIVLRSVRVNGEILTCEEWVRAFEAERLRAGQRKAEPPRLRTNRQRQREHEAARRRLEREGFGD